MKLRGHIRVPRGGGAALLAAAMVCAAAAPHTGAATAALAGAAPAAATSPGPTSSGAASARAVSSGKAVLVADLTTPTREVTANPNGSFTMTVSPAPVRVEKQGRWVGLDATLRANPDGSLSPAAVPGTLVLSSGGTGALATMTSGNQQMSVALPATLPRPTVSGDTATYANVLPGTDLVVTATTQGGFSDVFVVHTPSAAHDPRLAGLLTAHLHTSNGLSLRTDAAGNLAADTSDGTSVFTAPAADAWDSATTGKPLSSATAAGHTGVGSLIPTGTHTPVASGVGSPGRYAHQASLGARLHDGTLTLSAPSTLTGAPAADFPIYLDPAYGPAVANFATVNSAFPTQPYINGSGTQGYMQVGYNGNLEGCSPCFNARSFVTLNMAGLPSNATHISAEVNFWDSWSASCTAEELDLWTTGPISTSGSNPTTWSHQPSWNSQVSPAQVVSKGWGSSCPAGGIGWNISSQVQSVLSAHGSTLTLGLRIPSSQESSNDDNWKQLNGSNSNQSKTTASVTYDVTPNTPSGLYTSPTTNCSATSPTILGDTGVTLYAPVSTTTNANLTTTFDFYKTSAPSTNLLTSANGIASDTYTGASGKPAVMVLPESFVKAQAGSGATTFAWKAETGDGTLTSQWSSACTFEIDSSRPGAPGVTAAAKPPAGSVACALVPNNASQPVGSSCAFDLTPPNGATISGYTYQINDAQPEQVAATGATTISVKMPGMVNTLTVSALSAGGNIGSSSTVWFDGEKFDPAETDGDLTADHIPDLLVAGNTSGAFPPGLWLAQGQRNGSVDSYAQNIGVNGLGFNGGDSPSTAADWNGSQAITGDFCGQGTQDVLAYFPGVYDATANPNGGGGAIVCGTGTTQPLQVPVSGNQYSITQNAFSDPNIGANASVITNGGAYDSVDDGNAYQLMYGVVPTGTSSGELVLFALTTNSVYDIPIGTIAPPGSDTDWNDWTVTAAQDNRGGATHTDMYLWDSTTGDLYLWAALSPNATSADGITGLSYTSYHIASNWNKGASLTLRAADIGGNGNPGLWATSTASGQTTAYVPPVTLAPNPTLSTSATMLTTANHSWQFSDMPQGASGSAVGTTADGDGSMPLTSATGSGVDWNTGDQFSPDAEFLGSGGYLSTGSGKSPLDLTKSFTVSFWTKPEKNGEMALSESGSAYPGLMIYPTPSGWDFYLAKDNGSAEWGGDAITGGNVDFGVWTHVQATYNASSHVMSLFVDDTFVATGTHAVPSATATGPLTLGADIDGGTYTSFYTGQIADVQTWSNSALAPNQAASDALYHQSITPDRILNTRNGGGPVGAYGTETLPIVGASVTPATSGAPITVPASATAVAIDVTLTAETSGGYITAYADGTQKPVTSSTNYSTNTTITCYQIVPIGTDGDIDFYNSSPGTTQLIVDMTGYFTSDPGLTGDQTYHPLPAAYRAVNTGVNDTNTNLPAGTQSVTPGSPFTMNVTGVDQIPTTATAVAVNLTATAESGAGYLEAYATGSAPASDTALTYGTGSIASLAADVPLGTGGTITILPEGYGTHVIADISGYYTNDTSGQVYHTVNPTRLVDTRSGIGGQTGPVASVGTYVMSDTAQITTATTPTLALMVTVTAPTDGGALTAYPDGTTRPGTSNANWATGQTIANTAVVPAGTDGAVDFYNSNSGTIQLVIDCSGYFANDAENQPTHQWALDDGTGSTTAADIAGTSPLTLNGGFSWATATVGSNAGDSVLGLDGSTAYGTTSGQAVNTAASFSVSAWANLNSIPTRDTTVAAESGNEAAGFYLQYNSYYKNWCMVFMTSDVANAGGYGTQACGSTAPTAGSWYHLVGTYDAISHTAALYVNGSLAGTASGITNWSATGPVTIGAAKYNATLTDYFPGDISDVETFDAPLSATQVGNLYQQLN